MVRSTGSAVAAAGCCPSNGTINRIDAAVR
jgi:hypothetical protein